MPRLLETPEQDIQLLIGSLHFEVAGLRGELAKAQKMLAEARRELDAMKHTPETDG